MPCSKNRRIINKLNTRAKKNNKQYYKNIQKSVIKIKNCCKDEKNKLIVYIENEIIKILKIIKNFPKDNIEINDKCNFLFNGYKKIFDVLHNEKNIIISCMIINEMKIWRSENLNNYLFSIDKGKNLIDKLANINLLFIVLYQYIHISIIYNFILLI